MFCQDSISHKNFNYWIFWGFINLSRNVSSIIRRKYLPDSLPDRLPHPWYEIETMEKLMREHHPMRYNRMTEILKIVAQGILMTFLEFQQMAKTCSSKIKVKLSSGFLLKSYFMKSPLFMLATLYIFQILGCAYIVFALARILVSKTLSSHVTPNSYCNFIFYRNSKP